MSDSKQGEGWWQASDGQWYPPEQHPDFQAGATQPTESVPPTAAMPPVPPLMPPPGTPVGPPPGTPVGPPPAGPPAAGSNNAKWIIVGVLGVAAVAIAAFLLFGGDDKKNNVSAVASSSSSSSSSSTSSSSSSRSSPSSKASSSSSGVTAAQLQAKMLKAAEVSPDLTDQKFTPDSTTPTPCGQPNLNKTFPPVIDVGSQASNAASDVFFQEELSVYKDASTASKAFDAGKASVSCTQGTVGSNSDPVTFSSPQDRSSELGVADAVEIDFQSGNIQGQLFAIHEGDSIATFQFAATTSVDTSKLPDALTVTKNGLRKLAS